MGVLGEIERLKEVIDQMEADLVKAQENANEYIDKYEQCVQSVEDLHSWLEDIDNRRRR